MTKHTCTNQCDGCDTWCVDPQIENIKPCPFCGTKPNFTSVTDLTDNFDHGFSIWCSECGIEMADEYKDEVAKRWNTRPAVSLTEDQICRSPLIEWLVPTTEEWNACEVMQDRYDLVKRLVHRVFKAEQYASDARAALSAEAQP